MNRLYAVESAPSSTGGMADHRLPMLASEIERLARTVARELGVTPEWPGAATLLPHHAQWVTALVHDLQKHRGASIVLAGEQQPPAVHALAHAMNHALGNVGKTVIYTDSVEADPGDQLASLRRAGPGYGSGAGESAGDPGQQPGIHCARRPALRGAFSEGQASDSPGASMRTKPACSVTGTSQGRIILRLGATRAPSTEPPQSSSR